MNTDPATPSNASALPLAGINVLDFGHTVMGPTCGLILADLGARVVRVERPEGDPTRHLKGFGAGFFGYLNRNKESLAIDLKDPACRPVMEAALGWADVVIENFGPDVMDRLGYGYSAVKDINPRLVYCSLKGFLPGPYQNRPALDEIVQMMGGLAYMTGPRGQPLRAGASIVDMGGGMFGVIGILAALRARDTTGLGTLVTSALYETTAFLVGQHIAMNQLGQTPVVPMVERTQAWGVYDLFDCADGQVFVGITSDPQWERFCKAFALDALAADSALRTNSQRVTARPDFLPVLADRLRTLTVAEVESACVAAAVPVAPVRTPLDLVDDPHLKANGSLLDVAYGTVKATLPALPVRVGSQMPEVRMQPQPVGAQTHAFLQEWGVDPSVVQKLVESGKVRTA
jgi:crotonobetainyl-CoA:carnitine CoA-transferase CaiB-like acyl-CoA transferase